MSTTRIVLASASPRRAQLLQQIGLTFAQQPADIDETPRDDESAQALARRLATTKAAAVAEPQALVIGADTVVALDDAVFGKPRDRAHAAHMLAQLSGRTHQVCSGVAVMAGAQCASRVCVSRVTMGTIDADAAAAYWSSGEPRGKAGGYAIQGLGAIFVEHLAGSYSGVMGLPLHETTALLAAFGVDVLRR